MDTLVFEMAAAERLPVAPQCLFPRGEDNVSRRYHGLQENPGFRPSLFRCRRTMGNMHYRSSNPVDG
jgi:hypothetical protein